MCELFGISAPQAVDAGAWLKTFFSHGNKNPHGWGLAIYQDDPFCHAGFGTIEKEPVRSDKSTYLHARLQQKITAVSLIAHIREATIGSMEYCNTHPFRMQDRGGRFWTLAHNGTIFEDGILRKYMDCQEGQTDSERLLFYFIDRINHALAEKRREITGDPEERRKITVDPETRRAISSDRKKYEAAPSEMENHEDSPVRTVQKDRTAEWHWYPDLSPRERCEVVADAVRILAPENKLNLLLCDGEILYVHTNKEGTLYYCKAGDGLLFATVPFMTGTSAHWEEVPFTSLCAYRDGRQIYQGAPHGHGFVDDPEKYRSLMMAYAAL